MGPWLIAGLCIVALAGLVVVVRLTRNPGTRAAPRRALDATPAGWGTMTLDPDPEAPSHALEVAHEDCPLDLAQIRAALGNSQTIQQTIAVDDTWADLPAWAHPLYKREAPYGWESGAGTARRDGGGWDFHEWDPWQPDPGSRLADTGDIMAARAATEPAWLAAEKHWQDADAELFLVGLAERARELAAAR